MTFFSLCLNVFWICWDRYWELVCEVRGREVFVVGCIAIIYVILLIIK